MAGILSYEPPFERTLNKITDNFGYVFSVEDATASRHRNENNNKVSLLRGRQKFR